MKSEDSSRPTQLEPQGVQRDRETPLPKKPSFLFFSSLIIGTLTLILITVVAYYGVFQNQLR